MILWSPHIQQFFFRDTWYQLQQLRKIRQLVAVVVIVVVVVAVVAVAVVGVVVGSPKASSFSDNSV